MTALNLMSTATSPIPRAAHQTRPLTSPRICKFPSPITVLPRKHRGSYAVVGGPIHGQGKDGKGVSVLRNGSSCGLERSIAKTQRAVPEAFTARFCYERFTTLAGFSGGRARNRFTKRRLGPAARLVRPSLSHFMQFRQGF